MANLIGTLRKKAGLIKLKWAFKKLSAKFNSVPSKIDPDKLLDIAYSKEYSLIEPWQNRAEIVEVLKIIAKNPPKSVLEIGTANGGTLFLLTRMAQDDALITSVDLPGGKFGGGYPKWKEFVYKSFAKNNQKINLLRANSHEKQTFNMVSDIFKKQKIEFMFIDGDHTYEGVKEDFLTYQALLADNALVMFHDIVPHFNPIYGVEKFWNEIKHQYTHLEFIESNQQDGKGLGLIFYKKDK
jgi:predicted O-methyltransferase YrrM